MKRVDVQTDSREISMILASDDSLELSIESLTIDDNMFAYAMITRSQAREIAAALLKFAGKGNDDNDA